MIHNSQVTRYFAIEFLHHIHFHNRNNTPAFPGIDTLLHTRFLHVSCTSSRLPCNSNALYFVSFLSINHDCVDDKKKGKRKKESEIKIPKMDLSTRRIIAKRFDVGKTKIGEGEG